MEATEVHKASDRMITFFGNLLLLKEKIEKRAKETNDDFLREVYEELDRIFKVQASK